MTVAVSVIIPVYNAEKYLEECLQSVAMQTIKNIQVILVDDGSTDTSAEICKHFLSKYENFEYYYKDNGGSASARNLGIEKSVGEYIGFVDSDDWIEPNMFERMYESVDGRDIVACNYSPHIADEYIDILPGEYSRSEMERMIFPFLLPCVNENGTFRSICWGNCLRLYKHEIITINGIRYFEKSRRCEDLAFHFECMIHAKSYVCIPDELYHYTPNPNSKSRSYTSNMWVSIKALMQYMEKIVECYGAYDFCHANQISIYYFCTMVVRNEMNSSDKKTY